MKKFVIVVVVLVLLVVSITLCFKSCQQNLDPLNLLPSGEPASVEAESPAIVEQIKQLAKLETVSMTIQQTMTATRDQDRLWGAFGEKLVFIAYAQVIAGIDLGKVSDGDIEIVDDKTIKVTLPPVEIFNVVMDNENSLVVDRDSGILAYIDPQLETLVRQRAEEEILKKAELLDILGYAEINATLALKSFIRQFGYTDIEIEFSKVLDLLPSGK